VKEKSERKKEELTTDFLEQPSRNQKITKRMGDHGSVFAPLRPDKWAQPARSQSNGSELPNRFDTSRIGHTSLSRALRQSSGSSTSAVLRGRFVMFAQGIPNSEAEIRNACVGVRLPAVSLSNPRRTPAGLVHTSLSRALRQSSGSSTSAVLRGRVVLFAAKHGLLQTRNALPGIREGPFG
jgi:hypothetical protein